MKQQYLMFGDLRAFPYQQLRKLYIALKDRTLPLTKKTVELLIVQTMYQVGNMSAASELTWKTDLHHGVLESIMIELRVLVKEHSHKPREHPAILALTKMLAYFSQWYQPGFMSLRELAREVNGWSNALHARVEICAPEQRGSLKARQCSDSTITSKVVIVNL
jgi:hypothetical protein